MPDFTSRSPCNQSGNLTVGLTLHSCSSVTGGCWHTVIGGHTILTRWNWAEKVWIRILEEWFKWLTTLGHSQDQASNFGQQNISHGNWYWYNSFDNRLSIYVFLVILVEQGTINIIELEYLILKLTIYFAELVFTCCSCFTVSLQSSCTSRSGCKCFNWI